MNRQVFSENITSGLAEVPSADLQGLIEASNRYDGIDFPFTLDELPSSPGELPTTLLYTVNQRVVGILCLYNWSGIELYGLVHPAYRRRGIGQALLAAAKEIAKQHEQKHLLLGCYGSLASGIGFASANQATLDHADYEMELDANRTPHSAILPAELTLRQAEASEIGQVVSIATQGFGEPEEEMYAWLTKDILNPQRRIFFIELQGNPIGTVRIIEGANQRADITLFCLLQPYRGRGYGKQILLSLVDLLLFEHRSPIGLDVSTSNRGALALYETCGFQIIRKDSYYTLIL